MHKGKTVLLLVLTLLLIAGGAVLPGAAAAVMDNATAGNVQYSFIQPVELELSGDTAESAPMMEKLALLCNYEGYIELTEKDANMSEKEVRAAASRALEPYISAGLMQPFEEWYSEWTPILIQDPDDPKLNGIVWSGTIVGIPEVYYVVDLRIDDETGKLLSIDISSAYAIEDPQQELLETFGERYFTELGITDYKQYATPDLENADLGEQTCGIRYRFGDKVYGEINVDLYVNAHSFYTYFPEL